MNRSQTNPPPKSNADWLAWSLHLLFGLVVGAVAGSLIAFRMRRLDFIDIDQLLVVITGISLFGGAITSYRGNRAWFPPSVFDAEEHSQSTTSRTCSLTIGGFGIVLFLAPVICHVSTDNSSRGHTFSNIDIFLLLLGGFFGFLVFHALRTGTAFSRFGVIDRDEAPLSFWLYVTFISLSVIYILISLFR